MKSSNDINGDNKMKQVNTKSDYYKNADTIEYKNMQDQDTSISVCIVIPTYNEAQNIPQLLASLYSEGQKIMYAKENISMNVLVVDDNSPDGTASVVKDFQKDNMNIHLLLRSEKNGLGAAYIAGMQHAMKSLRPDILFEMDGDLSHGPEYVLPMIRKVRKGADFVIGSRYVKGGSIPENWGIKRKLVSRIANLYAKTVLGIRDINDCTGGFRAIRASALEQIDLGSLKTKGYAFQISLLEEMRRSHAIIKEVPIAFKDRTNGDSKMRLYDILEEGLFVLNASLRNIFYSIGLSRRSYSGEMIFSTAQDQESVRESVRGLESIRGSYLQDANLANNIQVSSVREPRELRADQVEFSQAFGLVP